MENASDGCVRNQDEDSILSTLATDEPKVKTANPYVNKPIFRRKLIEKYSTARYNINTKRVLVKIPPSSLSYETDEVPKQSPPPPPHKTNSPIENAENNLPSSSKVDSAAPSTRISRRRTINAENTTKNSGQTSASSSSSPSRTKLDGDKTPNSRSSPIPSESLGASAMKPNYSPNAKKRKLDSATTSSPATIGMWKIAPKTIYNHLLDMCQSTVEAKPEELKKEAAKKRKICHWTKRRSRKKPTWLQKPKPNTSHFDPYVECLKEAENQSDSPSAGTGGSKLGIVMYLGVNRPMFPLVYRNLRVLNDSNDEKITDFWAEFALSTLITKRDDIKCKPVLVPIRDPELATLVSECVDATVVRSKIPDVSVATSASDGDSTITSIENTPEASCIKQEESTVLENDSKPEVPSLQRVAKPYKLRNKKSRKKTKAQEDESASKVEENELESVTKVEAKNEPSLETNNEENERKSKLEEIERKSKAEEEAKTKSMLEELKRKWKAEKEAKTQSMLEETKRKSKAEEEAKRKSLLEETKRKSKAEEEAKTQSMLEELERTSKAEKEAKTKSMLEETKRKSKAEEEAKRKLTLEEIKRRSRAEEEAKTKAMLREITRKLEEDERQAQMEEIERTAKIEEVKRKSKLLETELKSKFEESGRKTKVEENEHPSNLPKAEETRRKPTSRFLEYQAENFVRIKRARAGPKSKSRSRPTTAVIRSKEDEKSILKKFGYKECYVAIPKLSDTLIKYLSTGNYSNQSAELSDPTERELIEDTDDFGLIQCTRTDGIIIDYVKRNRSSVYFYKLKKMLDFQRTNNKYFVCCDYILVDRTETDRDIDIESLEDDEDAKKDVKPFAMAAAAAVAAVRSSRNPNDLFKVSKLSEFKNKTNTICWVKNHDLKLVADVKWLLISLDKSVASLSHASGCVLRYRLLFEIIYRAELSKKVICCQITKLPEESENKMAFGVYAFPGLCDKLLVGPYSFHEEHQLSAFVRTAIGSTERAPIRTLEEKENFPQLDDSYLPVKHINAKWWSGKRSSDLTEQYLNFFFNPSVVKYPQPPDKINLAKIIDEHPCYNYHSYEITGRENNLVLFHDRTNAIEKSAIVPKIKIPAIPDVVKNTDNVATKDPPPTVPPKQSRNLRKKPRQDYSQLVTDDMAIPLRARNSKSTKNWNFHIVDVKSLRKRGGPRPAKSEGKVKKKSSRSRYHEKPQVHIMNERIRRLEFRNRRNNLASVLESRPTGSNNAQSLVSILHQAKEIISYLNVDNEKLDEEGKRLRAEQAIMMRKFLALLRGLDINSAAYKNGMNFVASWKKIKANHRNKLIEILGQSFDKYKANKAAELSRIAASSDRRVPSIRPLQRFTPTFKRLPFETQSGVEGIKNESNYVKDEDASQCMNSRKKKRQMLREGFRKRNNLHQKNETEVVECEISEEVIGGDGRSLDAGEIPILVPDMASGGDPYAVDPLADDDEDYDDGPASSFGGRSSEPRKEPSHPLYYEHSYSCLEEKSIDLTNEHDRRIPVFPIRGHAMKKSEPTFTFLNRNRLNIVKNLAGSSLLQPQQQQPPARQQQRRTQLLSPNFGNPLTTSSQQRRNPILVSGSPILKNSIASSQQRRNPIPVPRRASSSSSSQQRRNPIPVPRSASSSSSSQQRRNQPIRAPTASSSSPAFQIVVRRTANDNLCIDIIDNGRVFARLNIAKVNDGTTANDAPCSSRDPGEGAGATTYTKIMTIIQRFLEQMEKTSPLFTTNEPNDDERSKQAKRRHVVNSLRSFISKFENRRKTGDDAGYSSSSRASNSDGTSPPYVTDNIDLDDGYSSKSSEAGEASCDQDANVAEVEVEAETEVEVEAETEVEVEAETDVEVETEIEAEVETEAEAVTVTQAEAEAETETVTVSSDHLINGGLAIENIVLDDDSDESQTEEEPEVLREDEFIAEEEEEEEIVCEDELIEEEEEEEEIVGEGNTLEEMNDVVDAAMRGDEGDRFANSGSPDPAPFSIPSHNGEPITRRTKTLILPKPSSKVLYTNQFTIIPKNKFIPNIMKTPTKVADVASTSTATSDYLSRIQIKPSVGSLVKLSAASLPPTSNADDDATSSGSNSNDSIIKRLWYSPVTRAESDVKILRRDSNFNEAGKAINPRSEKEKSTNEDDDDSKSCEKENSNSETESNAEAEQDNSGANRIVIKSFANHNKFREAFLSNVDKLLNPES